MFGGTGVFRLIASRPVFSLFRAICTEIDILLEAAGGRGIPRLGFIRRLYFAGDDGRKE
jgi:hypothetical protein